MKTNRKYAGYFWLCVGLLFLLPHCMCGEAQRCVKDTDCKGERICELGICLTPGKGESPVSGQEKTQTEENPETLVEVVVEKPIERDEPLKEQIVDASEISQERMPEENRQEHQTERIGDVEAIVEAQQEAQIELNVENQPPQFQEVLIPSGTFMMGSPTSEIGRIMGEDLHQVTLTRSFYMGKYEVTQGEFQALMGFNPSRFLSCGANCPVENLTWHHAAAYANALSDAKGFEQCFDCTMVAQNATCTIKTSFQMGNYYNCLGYRLPTEAEWEYAYRAGTSTAFYNGEVIGHTSCPDPNADLIAWYCNNSGNMTQPVGGKLPNAWGLYDMSGNVTEWCYDAPLSYPRTSVTDPVKVTNNDANRVMRSGSYASSPRTLRAAARVSSSQTNRNMGFRVARTHQ